MSEQASRSQEEGPTPNPWVHHLKCLPEFFDRVIDGSKNFEIRRDDRGFQVGDKLVLEEWDGLNRRYTGAATERTVTYITNFAQRPGFVVMGMKA